MLLEYVNWNISWCGTATGIGCVLIPYQERSRCFPCFVFWRKGTRKLPTTISISMLFSCLIACPPLDALPPTRKYLYVLKLKKRGCRAIPRVRIRLAFPFGGMERDEIGPHFHSLKWDWNGMEDPVPKLWNTCKMVKHWSLHFHINASAISALTVSMWVLGWVTAWCFSFSLLPSPFFHGVAHCGAATWR